MKCFRDGWRIGYRQCVPALCVVLASAIFVMSARGSLPNWVRNAEAGSAVESALFRLMSLPGGSVLFRRPPRETRPALGDLIKSQPNSAELYLLRAAEDEQQLDFVAAEADWKAYADKAIDKLGAQTALADFYHRRMRPLDEIKTLAAIANTPSPADEKFTPAAEQRSWQAFERIFGIIEAQGLPKDESTAQYRAWLARYPSVPSLPARFLEFLVSEKDYAAARQLIADYQKQFPADPVFPVRARALMEYRQGSAERGLAVYDEQFQPLWPPDLVKSYFDFLKQTDGLRKFLDAARAARNANHNDLNAIARIFYYYQQQGKLETAQQTVTEFRLNKEATRTAWSARELYVCARLLEDIHVYPEAARYYFALYNSGGGNEAQEQALTGLANLLLTAPESQIRLGAGDLSLYRDIATMDQGPGYLNGILSLILNGSQPAWRFQDEDRRAVPYFHRAKAVELLAMIDAQFPQSAKRPELHAKLLDFYARAGESEIVIQGGRAFLAAFPNVPQRTTVALTMANADARIGKTDDEFTVYDSVLQELAAKAQNVPLGARVADAPQVQQRRFVPGQAGGEAQFSQIQSFLVGGQTRPDPTVNPYLNLQSSQSNAGTTQIAARSPEYARVLDRYLARLVELKQIPRALGVLRKEMDRNPDDPGLFERLAVFLEQNQLGAEQEDIYRRAIAKFQERSWYHKLARFYLRYKKDQEFENLTRDAVKTFNGTELENYFSSVVSGGSPTLYLRLNQYASQRFPHNPVFVRNLLNAYHNRNTYNDAAWQALIRQHWFEESDLRDQFFAYLSRTGRLETELAALRQSTPEIANGNWSEAVRNNPAAGEFVAQANLWRSHFEESAPALAALASEYPANADMGHVASAVYRSLAYFEPADTATAAKIEDNLLQANPGDTSIMARIGDIYADRNLFSQAAPYWNRIQNVEPGRPAQYLEEATIYWDYFDFENALRVLRLGRNKLGKESLYSYQAGAIYENSRDYQNAIAEYIKGAVQDQPNSPSARRLIQLTRRPQFRDRITQQTANIGTGENPTLAAIELRIGILEVQDRRPEMASFLDAVLAHADSTEQAEAIDKLAQQKSLESVREHALQKEIALTKDPVTRLQRRYELAQFYEGRKDFNTAQSNIEAIYRENPKVQGVVRSTADFYWRRKMFSQAVNVLLQAAKDAYPALRSDFSFEAARKSTEAGQYQQARELLAQLSDESPYDPQYLAAMADTYARTGDDQGLKQFYLDKIAIFQKAPMAPEERKSRIAILRRGVIPALTRLKQYAGAVDQYIELINNFPEDAGLTTESALYASRYQREQQLADFFAKTVAQSPRDFRWSMVLARIQTSLEAFPEAIGTYAKAIAVRPDRLDLVTARAGLEERLLRFDDGVADYERAYQLSYKDPNWKLKVAELRARQGRADDVVAALKSTLIDGHPEKADKYFDVAQRLENWGLLKQAQTFAEQGVNLAGAELLATREQHAGARVYARILTRLRDYQKAYATLDGALKNAASSLPVIQQQVAREGIAAVTDSEFRRKSLENRTQSAREGFRSSLAEMGNTAAVYFTPEEKVSFATFVQAHFASAPSPDLEMFAVTLAQSSGLADLEAHWRYQLMLDATADESVLMSRMGPFVELQRRRLQFAEMATQLEPFASRISPERGVPAWLAAAEAYRAAGDSAGELRMLIRIQYTRLGPDHQTRLHELLLAQRPQELVQRSADRSPQGETAATYVVANGDATLAHAVVATRGRGRAPVWSKAYNALVGLYFAESTQDVNTSFLSILGNGTIGERLAKPVDRSQQLAGETWFYYGSRYGEYLGLSKQVAAEDFLPAMLEQSPATATAYAALAGYYADKGDTGRAIADYSHSLELNSVAAGVLDRLALAHYKQGNRAEALNHWKQALSALLSEFNNGRLRESFWTEFSDICDHLHTRRVFATLKPDADRLIRAYLRRNGNYRSNALLRSAYTAMNDPAAATDWLFDLATAAHDPALILSDVADVTWIPVSQRALIYRKVLQIKQERVQVSEGRMEEFGQEDLRSWELRFVRFLVITKQYKNAAEEIASFSTEERQAMAVGLIPFDLQIAAQLKTLDSRIDTYRSAPEASPKSEVLRAAARQLVDTGDIQSARKLLEFVFARDIDDHKLEATNFLGLADIRIAAGDMPGAMELLKRLVVVVGLPFENLDPASELLEKAGKQAEAAEFLQKLVQSSPWRADYRVRLAKALIASKSAPGQQDAGAARNALAAVASSSEVAYAVRAQAAAALGVASQTGLGSKELNLLAGGAGAADQSYFYEARLKSAGESSDAQLKLQLLRNALKDNPARMEARLPLFRASVINGSDEFALAVIEPLLRRPTSFYPPEGVLQFGRQFNYDEAAFRMGNTGQRSRASVGLSESEQAQMSWEVGNLLVRLNRRNEALQYLQLARRQEKSAARLREIDRKAEEVRIVLRRDQTNAGRQPILHDALEQNRVVRPRLVARAAPAAAPANQGGAK